MHFLMPYLTSERIIQIGSFSQQRIIQNLLCFQRNKQDDMAFNSRMHYPNSPNKINRNRRVQDLTGMSSIIFNRTNENKKYVLPTHHYIHKCVIEDKKRIRHATSVDHFSYHCSSFSISTFHVSISFFHMVRCNVRTEYK